MKTVLFLVLIFSGIIANAQRLYAPTGSYSVLLELNPSIKLPFKLEHQINAKKSQLIIHNGIEKIFLNPVRSKTDTLFFSFPNFDAELAVVSSKKTTTLKGIWLNNNRIKPYSIPFSSSPMQPKSSDPSTTSISGKWDSKFDVTSTKPEVGIGVFEQKNDSVFGTILTETGDYRYLAGTIQGNIFYLSCFDGSHAFLLEGTSNGNNITGTFFSGKHYQTTWEAKRNDNAKLKNADSITFLKNETPISFTLPDLTNTPYVFPNEKTKNKVVIVQIMGTWCPNCMDETNFYKELYDKYHDRGLEIISVGYEAVNDFAGQAQKIQRMKERKQLPFQFLVGGTAQKSLASKQFSMLNEIISFPTSIYIGRDGLVKRIHTGFSGPGTGSYYTDYVTKTTALIEELLGK